MPSAIKKIFYGSKGIRLFWPIVVVILLIVLGELVLVDPFGKLLQVLGLSQPVTSNAQEWSPSIYNFFKRGMRSLVVVLSVWFALCVLMKKPFSFTGFILKKGWLSQLLLGILLGFVIQVTALILMVLFGWYSIEGFLWDFMSAGVVLPALVFAFAFSAETGIIEETFFRGFFMNAFTDRYSLKVGVVISSLFFGVLHFAGFTQEFPWWMSLISAVAAGFLFAQAYLLFNNIWVPLGIHFAWHFASRTLGTPGVSPEEACLLVTNVKGPILWVVTKAGGASLVELIGVGVCALIIFLINKKSK